MTLLLKAQYVVEDELKAWNCVLFVTIASRLYQVVCAHVEKKILKKLNCLSHWIYTFLVTENRKEGPDLVSLRKLTY